jgi:hypothetical protein
LNYNRHAWITTLTMITIYQLDVFNINVDYSCLKATRFALFCSGNKSSKISILMKKN